MSAYLKSYVDRLWGKHPDTNRIRFFLFLMYCIDCMVMNLLPVFMNQARVDLGWTPTMTSLALGILPFAAIAGTIIIAMVSGSSQRNVFVLRVCMFAMFASIMVLTMCGLFMGSGYRDGQVTNAGLYYGKYVIFIVFSSLIQGLQWGMQPCSQSIIADINNREGSTFGSTYAVGTFVYVVCSPISGLISQSLGEGYIGYLYMFAIVSPFAIFSALFTFPLGSRIKKFHSIPKVNEVKEESNSIESNKGGLKAYLDILKNRPFMYYLIFAALCSAMIFTFDSTASNMWTGLAPVDTEAANVFTPLNWGFLTSVGCATEFIVLNIVSRICKGRGEKWVMAGSALSLTIRGIAMAILASFFYAPGSAPSWVAWTMMALNVFRGLTWGSYMTVNVPITDKLLGPELRQRGVFIIPVIYQLFNGIVQFIYPQITGIAQGQYRFTIFAFIAVIGLISTLGFVFMKEGEKEGDHSTSTNTSDYV